MHRKVRYDIDKPGCTTAKIKVRYYFKKYLGIYCLAEVDIMYINIYRNLPTTKEKSMKKWGVDSVQYIYIFPLQFPIHLPNLWTCMRWTLIIETAIERVWNCLRDLIFSSKVQSVSGKSFKPPLSLIYNTKKDDISDAGSRYKPRYSEPRYSEFRHIVNKTQLLFWGFTKHITFDIVNYLI